MGEVRASGWQPEGQGFESLMVHMHFYYNYILESLKDKSLYKGCTKDLNKRLKEHNNGLVIATRYKRPWKIIYYEACLDQKDAYIREKYFKSGWGRRFTKERLKSYLQKK